MSMTKVRAIELLGGSPTTAAEKIGVTPSAISQWPDELPRRLEDRVLAALARDHLPANLLGLESQGDGAPPLSAAEEMRDAA